MTDFHERLSALRRERRAFAVATVVGRRPPVSAHLGDRALVFADGRMEGFVGGACARDIVRKQALEAIRARQPRLVSIRPDAAPDDRSGPDHVIVAMTCTSEGAVDVFVEPIVQPRTVLVVGTTPVACAVARLARSLEYDVAHVVDARERQDIEAEASARGITVFTLDAIDQALGRAGDDLAVVVASQGHYDEEALAAVLTAKAAYVGLVASRKRGAVVTAWLQQQGVAGVEHLRTPAGLDLGARTPAEVALSILAEIVQASPALRAAGNDTHPDSASRERIEKPAASASAPHVPVPETAIDPVCGMEVGIADARHTETLDGQMYYFCCMHCRTEFARQPHRYLTGAR